MSTSTCVSVNGRRRISLGAPGVNEGDSSGWTLASAFESPRADACMLSKRNDSRAKANHPRSMRFAGLIINPTNIVPSAKNEPQTAMRTTEASPVPAAFTPRGHDQARQGGQEATQGDGFRNSSICHSRNLLCLFLFDRSKSTKSRIELISTTWKYEEYYNFS